MQAFPGLRAEFVKCFDIACRVLGGKLFNIGSVLLRDVGGMISVEDGQFVWLQVDLGSRITSPFRSRLQLS